MPDPRPHHDPSEGPLPPPPEAPPVSPKDAAKVIDVAIGVLVERIADQPRLLIARRPHHGVLGGFWELPGGKVEPGETLAQCLAREFEEELGLSVRVGEPLPIVEHAYDHGHIRLHPMTCTRVPRADGSMANPVNLHVSDHRWASADELAQFTFPPANAALMRGIEEWMRR